MSIFRLCSLVLAISLSVMLLPLGGAFAASPLPGFQPQNTYPSGQGTSFQRSGMQQQASPPNAAQPDAAQPHMFQPQPLYVPGPSYTNGRQMTNSPAWAQPGYMPEFGPYPPFGANLFQGQFAGTYYEGMNEGYVIMPGDRIMIQMWGAQTYSDVLMVDQQGNIFLPEVGPVPVAGTRHAELQGKVKAYLASVYQNNQETYVNLLTAQPVAVYVTGFVNRPGRYAGGMSDTALYYLDRAGGIIPGRGSYRNIKIQRYNNPIATVDLYSFILNGKLPGGYLQDGDVIVVGEKGDSVLADGLIAQRASYEGKGKTFTGAELVKLASPLPAASHVSISGTRNNSPFNVYLKLADFAKFALVREDRVEFLADKPGETIMVAVNGSVTGSTRYPVKKETTLLSLLAYVPIDATLSNLSGIYLKRKSVAVQQKKALADALFRLESSVLTATSSTAETTAIRVQEAELVQNFAKRVATLEPDGIVVVTRNGVTSDIMLEDGDEIIIPQHSDVVQTSGEVMMPKAVIYAPGKSLSYYVQNSGGFTDRADKSNILIVHPNGEIAEGSTTKVQPGDLLMVMPEYSTKSWSIFKDIIQVLYQVAIATKVALTI